MDKIRAPRNRTLTCSEQEMEQVSTEFLFLREKTAIQQITNRIVHQDINDAIPFLPDRFVDLLILDPPYNLTKDYNGHVFRSKKADEYGAWFDRMITALMPALRPDASVYVCSDWRTSNIIFPILDRHLIVRNRITWEREKGRGAKQNWKNNTEDIWFCTVGDDYHFDVEAVKLKKRVVAPYRTEEGDPKDWEETTKGNYRLTHPSNIWADITVPFWSMPENTDHPTQKPEKLIAKLILASSEPDDFVFDPFVGSGTTAVVAQKLGRRFCGVEINQDYCCWAMKRLKQAQTDPTIQGYSDGVFWERNTLAEQQSHHSVKKAPPQTRGLFDE